MRAATPKNCRSPSAAKPRTTCHRASRLRAVPRPKDRRKPTTRPTIGSKWVCTLGAGCNTDRDRRALSHPMTPEPQASAPGTPSALRADPTPPSCLPPHLAARRAPSRGQPGLAWMDPSLGGRVVSPLPFPRLPEETLTTLCRRPSANLRNKPPVRKHFREPPSAPDQDFGLVGPVRVAEPLDPASRPVWL